MTFENAVDKIAELLDDIRLINHGGCGIVTLAMIRYCRMHNVDMSRVSLTLAYESWDTSTLNKNHICIKKNDINFSVPSHIGLWFNQKLYDGRGISEDKDLVEFQYLSLANAEDVLLQLINKPQGKDTWKKCWNYAFEREFNVPKIQHKLNVDLSDISVV